MRLTPQGISSFRPESKIVRLREFLPSERWKDLEVGTSLPVKTYSVAIMILPITLLTRSSFSQPGIYLGMSRMADHDWRRDATHGLRGHHCSDDQGCCAAA
jgi:hypothetical protein